MAPRLPATPQSPLALRSPIKLTTSAEVSPTATLVNGISPLATKKPVDKLEAVFQLHDALVKREPADNALPFTNIVSVGAQSAGKTTVLSMITGIPLWSASSTATIAPTQIHSRHKIEVDFSAHIEIEVTDVETPYRISFTASPIMEKGRLAEAMRWAGYVARDIEQTGQTTISYDEIYAMSAAAREAWIQVREDVANQWTSNTVILYVDGRQQHNVSIVDLPGLMGGDNGRLTKNLIRQHISKPHNLILLCLAVGTSDLSCDAPEVKLVRECDPKGIRTMCLLTKADKVDDPSVLSKMVSNQDPNWKWTPAHGWWPVSPRTYVDVEQGRSELDSRSGEKALFSQRKWQGVQLAMKAQSLGTPATRAKLYKVFENMVVKHVSAMKKLHAAHVSTTIDELALLPPEIDQPVGKLHDLINLFADDLRSALTVEDLYTGQLFQLQVYLGKNLTSKIPLFLPFFEDDVEKSGEYRALEVQGWDGTNATEEVYLDQVITLVKKFTSPRNGACDLPRLREHFIGRFAGTWQSTCDTYIDTVWTSVRECIEVVARATLNSHPSLQLRIASILEELQRSFKDLSSQSAARLCSFEQKDPNSIDIIQPDMREEYMVLFRHLAGNYAQIHGTTMAESHEVPATPPRSDFGASPSPDVETRSTEEERRNAFRTMASCTIWLVRGVQRVTSVVGRDVQGEVLEFLDAVVPALRKGMGLERVIREVEEASGTLLEPDKQTVEQRRGLKRKHDELLSIGEQFRALEE